ncbi:MAG: ubiquinol-cytochrome C chaperone family protein [Hyphomicrobiaceae bacterium]|nr:ubiquinol-cytochrome C chaperone family protein [Hyphomicrobiaceae bacterium]
MLNWLKERQARSRSARDLYGSIVTQARQPGFYLGLGVPDTPRGRFELIVLHTALVLRRLQQEGHATATLARALSETFVTDMDDNMRELTFSDLAVPREVKKVAAALFDRHGAIIAALDSPGASQAALAEVIARDLAYVAAEGPRTIVATALASYVEAASRSLSAQGLGDLLAHGPVWPAPLPAEGARA